MTKAHCRQPGVAASTPQGRDPLRETSHVFAVLRDEDPRDPCAQLGERRTRPGALALEQNPRPTIGPPVGTLSLTAAASRLVAAATASARSVTVRARSVSAASIASRRLASSAVPWLVVSSCAPYWSRRCDSRATSAMTATIGSSVVTVSPRVSDGARRVWRAPAVRSFSGQIPRSAGTARRWRRIGRTGRIRGARMPEEAACAARRARRSASSSDGMPYGGRHSRISRCGLRSELADLAVLALDGVDWLCSPERTADRCTRREQEWWARPPPCAVVGPLPHPFPCGRSSGEHCRGSPARTRLAGDAPRRAASRRRAHALAVDDRRAVLRARSRLMCDRTAWIPAATGHLHCIPTSEPCRWRSATGCLPRACPIGRQSVPTPACRSTGGYPTRPRRTPMPRSG
ncbi:hypothetical protein SAMN04489764_0047 [Thermostaphylospora chromogena]|uniref:Uncharacterized protein n=1 Tax=Thermostaphylospora chromogena TaxID=35622 RepID=A0A1H0XKL5_9ACTN|nr:hypothetical protein SAMN04489764_0047 [Thermostaphylospora chromogena]